MEQETTRRVVAVTGASGLIGKRVVDLLLQQENISIRVLSHTSQLLFPAVASIQGDVLSISSLQEFMRGATHLVHLAGVAHTDLRSAEARERAMAVNVRGTQNVLDCALASGVKRLLVASSAHVYAGQQGLNLSESSPVSGDSAYAQMKLALEDAVDGAASNGLNAVIVRPCLTYGAGVRFNLDSLMRAVHRGYYFHVRGVDPSRSLASVDTVAAAVVHLLFLRSAEGRFNIADRMPVQLCGWVDNLADRMGVRHPRVLPMGLVRAMATVGTAAKRVGLPAPLNGDSLGKLTASFTLDVSKLAATGFVWPKTQNEVLTAMVKAATGSSVTG